MIYLDNAATGGFKHSQVYEGAINTMKYLNANAGHSAHKLAVCAEEYLYRTRKEVCSYFGLDKPERVIFTKNCTEALNLAILGTVKHGGNVVTTCFEHNSVLRPLYSLKRKGLISLTIVKPANKFIMAEDIARAVTEKTYLVCATSASNVTGNISDYEAIGAYLRNRGITFLVDGAQGAGHLYIDMRKHNIDIFCFSGHKGIGSLQGVGCLLFNKNVNIQPTFFGGSGSESFAEVPSCYPEMLECGTHNLPAINSLLEAILISKQNFSHNQKVLVENTKYLCDNLSKIRGITLYSQKNPVGIVSFSYQNYSSQEIAGVLSDVYDIAVRGGYHCAPLTHNYLGTQANGLIRASLSAQNTRQELDKLIGAFYTIRQHLC